MMRSILTLAALLYINFCFAQTEPVYRTCDTDFMWEKAVKADPSAAVRRQQLADFAKAFAPQQRVAPSTQQVIYVIPVVFHVIHDYGIENISRAQIMDALDIMNLSFQKLNDDTSDVIPLFQPIFADCQIEFRMATLDPSGNCTDGITRTQSDYTYDADDNVKSLIDWPSNKYLNIWVVANIGSGAAGYSYYPGISASVDGIVIRHDYVGGIGTSNGSNYTERSLTHEIGHWLDLPHTWGSTNSPGIPSNCFTDDGIFDTPNTIGTNNFSCNLSQNTCGQIDNVQNYMDYSGCHKMFTEGQKAVMHAALNSSVGGRNNLGSPSNLIATGTGDGTVGAECALNADFSDRKLSVCVGTTVTFKDFSWGSPVTTWQWTLNGGTPSTSNDENPSVQYNTPGLYDVTLTVSNAAGSDQLIRTGFVEVLPDTGPIGTPYAEGFETMTWPSGGWNFSNPNNNNTWSITSAASSTGTKSLEIINHTGNAQGSVDIALSPTYDFSNVTAVYLQFDVAYAQKTSADASSLKVSASNNCGQSWIIRYNKSGSLLATASPTLSPFIPSALQWRTETVSLTSASISGKPSIRIKFEYTNSQGNNIFIDNINITGTTTSIGELSSLTDVSLYPNPSSGFTNVDFSLIRSSKVLLNICDVTGRTVYETGSNLNEGDHSLKINHNLSPGIYMLKMTAGTTSFSRKLVIE